MIEIEPGDFRKLAPSRPADLVLTDPPYNIGYSYGPVSDRLPESSYVAMMKDFSRWSMDNTADDAHLFVVHYPDFFFRHGHSVFCDYGGWQLQQLIRWCYPSNIGHSKNRFTRSSRDVAWFVKGRPYFDPKADPEPYKNPTDKRVAALIADGSVGRAPYDWWTIDLQKNVGRDYAGYSNQLPKPLLRRIILSSTMPGQLVIDPFAGTGSTLRVADAHERDAWGCDANPDAPALKSMEVR